MSKQTDITPTAPATEHPPCVCPLKFKNCKGNCDFKHNERAKEEARLVKDIYKAITETAAKIDALTPSDEYWSLRGELAERFTDLFSLNFLSLEKEELLQLIVYVSKWGMVGAGVFLMRIRFMVEGGTVTDFNQEPRLTGRTFEEELETFAGELPYVKRVNYSTREPLASIVFDKLQLPVGVCTKVSRWMNVRGLDAKFDFSPEQGAMILEIKNPTYEG